MKKPECEVCGGTTCPHPPRIRFLPRYPFAKWVTPAAPTLPRRARPPQEDRMRRPETHERGGENR